MSWSEIMTSNTASEPLFQNTFILKRPRVAIFAKIIKTVTMFIKTILKEMIKEIEIMYPNAIYICISRYNKIC